MKEIDTDSNIIDGDPNRKNEEEGRIAPSSLESDNDGGISNGEGTKISSLSLGSSGYSSHVAGFY